MVRTVLLVWRDDFPNSVVVRLCAQRAELTRRSPEPASSSAFRGLAANGRDRGVVRDDGSKRRSGYQCALTARTEPDTGVSTVAEWLVGAAAAATEFRRDQTRDDPPRAAHDLHVAADSQRPVLLRLDGESTVA